jgi:hypothetical protein
MVDKTSSPKRRYRAARPRKQQHITQPDNFLLTVAEKQNPSGGVNTPAPATRPPLSRRAVGGQITASPPTAGKPPTAKPKNNSLKAVIFWRLDTQAPACGGRPPDSVSVKQKTRFLPFLYTYLYFFKFPYFWYKQHKIEQR